LTNVTLTINDLARLNIDKGALAIAAALPWNHTLTTLSICGPSPRSKKLSLALTSLVHAAVANSSIKTIAVKGDQTGYSFLGWRKGWVEFWLDDLRQKHKRINYCNDGGHVQYCNCPGSSIFRIPAAPKPANT
jgi:hypothetical protein